MLVRICKFWEFTDRREPLSNFSCPALWPKAGKFEYIAFRSSAEEMGKEMGNLATEPQKGKCCNCKSVEPESLAYHDLVQFDALVVQLSTTDIEV